jgi:hypothetical protein
MYFIYFYLIYFNVQILFNKQKNKEKNKEIPKVFVIKRNK